MSYILDALKKSDQQRQRGAAPTLRSAPVIEAPPKKNTAWISIAIAVALLIVGVVIGWLRPWQGEAGPSQSASNRTEQSASGAVTTAASGANAPATMIESPAMPSVPTTMPPPAESTAPAMPASPRIEAQPPAPATLQTPIEPAPDAQTPPANSADAAQAKPEIPALTDLSPAIRQEMPALNISLHAYSPKREKRLVSINNQLLREGDTAAPGVVIEEITPDGMVLNFRGMRFRRGVQ